MTPAPGSRRLLALLVAVALVAPAVFAQTDPAAAEALFREGLQLKKAGKLTEACPKLEESYKLDPQGGTLFLLADCLEQQGRVASAWARFQEAADFARRANKKDKEEESKKRMAALEGKLPKLTVVVPAALANADGLEVRRDGLPLGKATWGTPLPVDPGKHVVEATAKGKKRWRGEVDVAKGPGVSSVNVPELVDEPSSAPPPPATTAPAATTTGTAPAPSTSAAPPGGPGGSRLGTPHYAGIGVAALGVGAVVLGFVFEGQSDKKVDDAAPHCPPVRAEGCDATGSQLYRDARSKHNLAVASWIGGGAAIVGGAALFFLVPRKTDAASVYLRPTIGGAEVGGRF